MTKYKVADLAGPMLDAAVALAEGIQPYNYKEKWCLIVDESEDETVVYEPSTDWEIAGPIIERERIEFRGDAGGMSWHDFEGMGYVAHVRPTIAYAEVEAHSGEGYGKTHLVAAMRAYVSGKLGAEIDL